MNADEIIEKYKLKDRKWTFKGFHGVLHTFFPVGQTAIKPLLDYYGDCFQITLFFVKENYVSWYWNEEDMERIRKDFIAKVNKNPDFLEQHKNDWRKKLVIFNKMIDKVEKANLSKLSDSNLIVLYKEFYKAYLDEFCIVMAIEDAFSMHADRFIEPEFRKILKEQGKEAKFNDYYPTLMAPVTSSFIEQELGDRLKIMKRIQQDKSVDKALQTHSKKYFWIKNNYAKMEALSAEFFNGEIKKLIASKINPDEELQGITTHCTEIKAVKEKIINELKLSQEFLNLIKITEVFAYIQDERKKYVLISNHYQKLFWQEIGKRTGLNEREMEYTVFPEMEDILLNKKFDKKQSETRHKHCVCVQTLNGYKILEGKVVDEIFDSVFGVKAAEVTEVKGTCASKGTARGPAKIILKKHDLVNVNQGDIIVTSMTRPEMVSAMERAAAIVTDEGGITSHAAIVSRELGIPCIIGTKIATHVFKDGDLIEVDANKGIAKKN